MRCERAKMAIFLWLAPRPALAGLSLMGGGARGKNAEKSCFDFCPGVLGFATPIGSTSVREASAGQFAARGGARRNDCESPTSSTAANVRGAGMAESRAHGEENAPRPAKSVSPRRVLRVQAKGRFDEGGWCPIDGAHSSVCCFPSEVRRVVRCAQGRLTHEVITEVPNTMLFPHTTALPGSVD